ncbi:O-methyltransferase [Terfezia claveryi]|nr:O-methyltransferase [Terfezia claveryi]
MHLATELFPNAEVTEAQYNYAIQNSTAIAPHIDEHRAESIKWAEENNAEVIMLVHDLQAQMLYWFTRMMGVKKVLEIGCFTGYSALCFAEGMKGVPDAELITLDLPGISSDFARAAFEKYKTPAHPPITLIEGRAAETLPTLAGKQFDLIFIDADKPGYRNYLDIILNFNLLVPGGVIIADNILRRGLVADSSDRNPVTQEGRAVIDQAKTLDEFNKKVLRDARLENVILPVFDGLNFVRLKKECA